MGLDIVAYEKADLVRDHDPASCEDRDHRHVYVLEGFDRSLRGMEPGCYVASGEEHHFRAGSYSGYNAFRAELASRVGLDVDEVWADPDAFADRPLFELVNFADNEGSISGAVAGDLLADLDEVDVADADGYFLERLADWRRAFEVASPDGFVWFI